MIVGKGDLMWISGRPVEGLAIVHLAGGDIYSFADGLACRARGFAADMDREFLLADRDAFEVALNCFELTHETWVRAFGADGPRCGVIFPEKPATWAERRGR